MCACACVFSLIAVGAPRLALVFVWIFTNMVTRAFDTFVLPLLGLVFLPWTTLFYVLAYDPLAGVTGIGWAFVILGFFFDISSYLGSGYGGRRSVYR
jgi:hypothetical protein